jgi:D-alanyl-D-alanine endopeptidase (penicillin-binding protein 7)
MDHWTVRGAKTGFTNLAGSCLVVRTTIAGRNVTAAFLGARGIDTRYGDAGRLRAWMEVKQAESEGETADQGG